MAGPDIRLFRGISFSSLPLFLKDILSVNVTVHILNIATLQERRERQLGAQPMTRGQEPRRDLCQGWGWWRKLFLVGSETGCHSRRRPLRGRLGSEGHVERRAEWTWAICGLDEMGIRETMAVRPKQSQSCCNFSVRLCVPTSHRS